MRKKYESRPEVIEAEINGAVADFDGGAYTSSPISTFKNSDDDDLRQQTKAIFAMINAPSTNNNIYVKGEEEFFFPTIIKNGNNFSSYINQIKDKHWAKLGRVLNEDDNNIDNGLSDQSTSKSNGKVKHRRKSRQS